MPKIVGNGVDLSKLQLRINYQNASKMPSGKDMYIVKDATVYNVKNLQSDVKKLVANKITKFYTNNNSDTVLNDSDDGKIQDLIIYGKSEQKQKHQH